MNQQSLSWRGLPQEVAHNAITVRMLGVGAWQMMLDKGQEDDGFGSPVIVTRAVSASVCLVSLAR